MERSTVLRPAGIWPTVIAVRRRHRRRIQLAAAALHRPSGPGKRLGRAGGGRRFAAVPAAAACPGAGNGTAALIASVLYQRPAERQRAGALLRQHAADRCGAHPAAVLCRADVGGAAQPLRAGRATVAGAPDRHRHVHRRHAGHPGQSNMACPGRATSATGWRCSPASSSPMARCGFTRRRRSAPRRRPRPPWPAASSSPPVVLILLPAESRRTGASAIPDQLALSLVVYALVMIVPINWLWLWSAKYLPPSRVSLIFSLEAVVGIVYRRLAGERALRLARSHRLAAGRSAARWSMWWAIASPPRRFNRPSPPPAAAHIVGAQPDRIA